MKVDIIYNVDCIAGLAELLSESVDAVVTDPPFGIGFYYWSKRESINNCNDYWVFLQPIYEEMMRILKQGGLLAIWQPAPYFRKFWCWYGPEIHIYAACKNFVQLRKTSINYGFDPIIMKYKPNRLPLCPEKPKRNIDFFVANTAKWVTQSDSIIRKHPCPRPIDQVEQIIENFVIEDGIVLDPFMGSGTTAVACKKLGRHYIGFEINPAYCKIAEQRLRECDGVEDKV